MPVRVIELVAYTHVRDRRTRSGSPYSGADLGHYAARLLAGAGSERNGTTIHLRSASAVQPSVAADTRPGRW